MQECSNSSANALELLQSCTKPSICARLHCALFRCCYISSILRRSMLFKSHIRQHCSLALSWCHCTTVAVLVKWSSNIFVKQIVPFPQQNTTNASSFLFCGDTIYTVSNFDHICLSHPKPEIYNFKVDGISDSFKRRYGTESGFANSYRFKCQVMSILSIFS